MAGKQRAIPRNEQSTPRLARIEGPFREAGALELDRVIHERVRLGIVSSLAVNGKVAFTELRDLLGITDGNLIAHTRKLEDVGYIKASKCAGSRVPKTEYRLTPQGRQALRAYLDHMEAIIEATRTPDRD
jgi:DNA-binding HxlR family transcriptional regulator